MNSIAKLIDHSMLKPDMTVTDVHKLCEEAGVHGFYSVCIPSSYIKPSRKALFETHVKIATVIGFPFGYSLPNVKIYEAIESAMNGVDELDIVLNISLAKSGKWDVVEEEIVNIMSATHGLVHKIIIETCYLTQDEKKKACQVVLNSGAAYIKTSTGFGKEGATIKDVELIRSVSGTRIGIKAAGGIRSLEEVKAFVKAGANRIGTSAGVNIMKEAAETGEDA
jgi:deoxyribose-phosphate aldolase